MTWQEGKLQARVCVYFEGQDWNPQQSCTCFEKNVNFPTMQVQVIGFNTFKDFLYEKDVSLDPLYEE